MKIALAQINPIVGDFSGNREKISQYWEIAAQKRADMVVFPELAVCGYPPADLLEKDVFLQEAMKSIGQLCELTLGEGRPAILCGTVMPVITPGGKNVRNVAALLTDGRVSFVQQKMLLPFYDVFDEQRYFEPAVHQALTCLNGVPIAITICEDAWNDKGFWPRQLYSVDPVEELMTQWRTLPDPLGSAPRIILNLSASPYWQGKQELRQEMLGALAKRHRAVVAMVNQVGGNDSLIFDGSSIALDADGQVIARGASFAEDLVTFDTGAPGSGKVAFCRRYD